jgi:CheY-like chemotaxis protein
MPASLPVAILGFSDFDRRALASHLRFARPGETTYQLVPGVDDGQIIIADADEAGAITLIGQLGHTAHTLFVGAQAPHDAGGWMMRPIAQAQVLRELDALAAQLRNPGSAPMPLLPATAHDSMWGNSLPASLDPIATVPAPLVVPARRASDLQPAIQLPTLSQRELNAQRRLQRERSIDPPAELRALVVDDSEVALHFLRRQLQAQGIPVDLAYTSDLALDLLARHRYNVVFLDVDLGDQSAVDGLTLCHQIRRSLRHPGGQAPEVVMVSAQHDAVTQVRGTLAGAMGYLGKPLDLAALQRVLKSLRMVQPVPPGGGGHPTGLSARPL